MNWVTFTLDRPRQQNPDAKIALNPANIVGLEERDSKTLVWTTANAFDGQAIYVKGTLAQVVEEFTAQLPKRGRPAQS